MGKLKTGLFFGSFNPIHIGHMIIANYMANNTDLDQIWFVVSPHNPHKPKPTLANDYNRLHLVRLAVEDNSSLMVSDIEFHLPKPSYTIDTLTYLREKYPNREFSLIMGGDNLLTLPKWKNYQTIVDNYHIYVYNRPGYEKGPLDLLETIHYHEAPLLNISATYIRNQIKTGNSIRYLVLDKVREELYASNMYS
jgi:nicotinate-nucleotide adenylyltransferase